MEPAFPRTAHPCMTYEDLGSEGADPQTGMTLRDYFAAHALVGLATYCPSDEGVAKTIAESAYRYADAMLKAR